MPADHYDWIAVDRSTAAVRLRSDQIVDDVTVARLVTVDLHQIRALGQKHTGARLLRRCVAEFTCTKEANAKR